MSGLVKQEDHKVEDSNVENIGSEEDRAVSPATHCQVKQLLSCCDMSVFSGQVKKAAALTELAWEGAGEEFGLQIWRINQFKVLKIVAFVAGVHIGC